MSVRIAGMSLKVLCAVAAGLLAAPASRAAADATADAALQQQVAPYLAPQHLVHIGKGRSINLVCLGHGSPTVVLTGGLGGWAAAWWKVQSPLARRTRVCAWDPAGYGFSSPSAQPQDIAHTTKDLEQTLEAGGIPGPYVMVAASLGAYDALRFTDLYRPSVVGMVLVDPSIPDQWAREKRIAPKIAVLDSVSFAQTVKQLRGCAAGLRSGTLKRGTPEFERCTAAPVPNLSADWSRLKAALARLKGTLVQLNTDPARLLTQASALEHVPEDSREVINAQRRYGNLPLIVLTARGPGQGALPPGTPGASTPAERAVLHQEGALLSHAWGAAHDAYAALSTRGRNQVVRGSGHNIAAEKPEAVISAVTEVLNAVRPGAQPSAFEPVPRAPGRLAVE